MKRLLTIVMTVVIVACFMPVMAFGAFDDSADSTQVFDISKSKSAENLDSDFTSKITLSLPSANYKPTADIVLVIDVSSSMKDADIKAAKEAAASMLNELESYENTEIKVGIVTFDRTAKNITNGLVSINDAKTKIDDIAAAFDTNMMAGLIAGKEMLDKGNGTEKYLVLMSDGIPIYWVNENGEPTCKTLELYQQDGVTLAEEPRPTGSEPEGSYTDLSSIIPVDELLAATDWDEDNDTWKMISDTGANIDNGYKYTNIQKSTYMTARYLQDEILGKYKLKAVAFGTDKYKDNVVYKCGENFCDWIGAQPGVSYYKVSKPNYGGSEEELVKAFSDISNEIVYVVDKGSEVVDEMGKTDDYDFDFINDLDKLTLTVGGKALDKEIIEKNHYGFGKLDNGSYRYELMYFAETDNDAEHLRWIINEAVKINNAVQLTYSVKLMKPKTEEGTYGTYDKFGSEGYEGLYTNNKAILYPIDSNGKRGLQENFARPTVSYTVSSQVVPPAAEDKLNSDVPKMGDAVTDILLAYTFLLSACALTAASMWYRKKAEK